MAFFFILDILTALRLKAATPNPLYQYNVSKEILILYFSFWTTELNAKKC